MADYKKDDQLIATHLGDEYEKYLGSIIPPIFMNSLHVFDNIEEYNDKTKRKPDSYFYGRVSNPTTHIVERKVAAMEHAEYGLAFASGMAAATTALMSVCKAGSHIICVKNAYGVLTGYIDNYCVPELGMSVTYVNGENLEEFEKAIQPNTDLIILESPVSLIFTVQDIRGVTALAKKHNIKTYIDNSYCTPIFQKPLDMGVDIVMHTASKYLGGHSDIIGGMLATSDEAIFKKASMLREMLGGIIGPMEAWLVMRGIRTLDVRVRRHAKIALEVATWLEQNEKVGKVYYPGLASHPQHELIASQQSGSTGLMSFEFKDASREQVCKFVNELKIFKIGVSWGGFESLVCTPMYPSTPEHAAEAGCGWGIVRIHCGLEGAANLISDLKQAMEAAGI